MADSRQMVAEFFRETSDTLARIEATISRCDRKLQELETGHAQIVRILEIALAGMLPRVEQRADQEHPLRSSDVHTNMRCVRGGDADFDTPTGRYERPEPPGAPRADQAIAPPSDGAGAASRRAPTLTSRWTGLWPAADRSGTS